MRSEEIQDSIEAGLKDSKAYIEGDGTHFTSLVVCPHFAGKSRIQRQQMVYDTVREQLMDGSLHALSVKTMTPEEWQAIDGEETWKS